MRPSDLKSEKLLKTPPSAVDPLIGTYPVAWNGHFFGPRNGPMRPF